MSAFLDKCSIVCFHGRVLWRLADLRYFSSFAARETNPVMI